MDKLDVLIAIEEIKKMRASFARFLDTKNWVEFEKLWAPDATLDNSDDGDVGKTVQGAKEITQMISSSLQSARSVHHAHAPEITILAPDRAQGIWAMEDRLSWPPGSPLEYLHGFGHYNETYVKGPSGWVVKTFRLTRLHVDMKPGASS